MRRAIRRIAAAAYGAAILWALSFGASEAFGRSVQLTCRYDGSTWLGPCIDMDEEECTARCQAAHPGNPDAHGVCYEWEPGGCCVCIW